MDQVRQLSEQLFVARRSLADRDDRIRVLTDRVNELTSLHGGTALAVAGAARRLVKRLLPPGRRRTRAVGAVLSAARGGGRSGSVVLGPQAPKSEAARYAADDAELAAEYRRWLQRHEPGPAALGVLRRANRTWERRPLMNVVLSVADATADLVDDSIDSVLAQVYDQWELQVAERGRPPSEVERVIDRYVAADSRIRFVTGGPEAGRRDVARARGEWLIRLDAGDMLRPDALHRFVAHIAEHEADDVIYADEDRLSPHGERERPELKPDWSPDYLLSRDYLGRPVAIRRSLLDDVDGWSVVCGPANDHDLHLRSTERARAVGHVAAVLATRRGRQMAGAISGMTGTANPVAEALRRRGRIGRAVPRATSGSQLLYDVRYAIDGCPTVDVIVPTRDRVDLLERCISSITERSSYPCYRITIVDNDSVEDATHRFLERDDLHVVRSPGPFNFSRIVNAGVRASDADYLLLLNNDVTVLTADWIEASLELAQQPGVGAVGCRLLFPDGSVQHEGVALLPEYVAANVSWPWPVIRNTVAVTAACMLVRRDAYWSIDGFDEQMGVVYNDVDFCLRLARSGWRVLYTPYAELEHDESATRGPMNPPADIDLFFARWGTPDRLHDPYVSPHVLWPHPQRLRL